MRIVHVVTLVSPDGAYGGPVRVAANHAAALAERGHDVVIVAGCTGYEDPPTELDGVPLQLFPVSTAIPKIGFAGLRAPGMSAWLRQHRSEFDVAHVHLARDLVTLPAAISLLRKDIPIVAQPHGMIVPNRKLLSLPLDRFATRPVLRSAHTVFHLTEREAGELTAVAGELHLSQLHNGVPLPRRWQPVRTRPHDGNGARADRPEVLFLARLHPRKRPGMFVAMARRLLGDGIDAQFTLVGPDGGVADDVMADIAASGVGDRVRYEGPVAPSEVTARVARAAISVLPSVDEPYPMSVLEAMSLGLPVVVTDSCGLADMLIETGSGLVVGPDLNSLTDAVRALLADPERAAEMGRRGAQVASKDLGMDAVAARLEATYEAALEGR